jgi:heptaprenylglyceryl phosphate synthase
MIDAAKALRALSEAGVDFIVVGGAAAIAHGSARLIAELEALKEERDKR